MPEFPTVKLHFERLYADMRAIVDDPLGVRALPFDIQATRADIG